MNFDRLAHLVECFNFSTTKCNLLKGKFCVFV